MSGQELVSICIPVYNQHRFVARAVQSALDQTYKPTEVIIVDNASTPSLEQELAQFKGRVRYIRHDHYVSMYLNFNRALALASGTLVKFLAADDEIAPSFVATATQLLKGSNVAFANVGEVIIDEQDRELPTARRYPERGSVVPANEALNSLRNGLPFCVSPSHSLYRTNVLKRLNGFNPRFLYADFHLWLRLLSLGDLGWSHEPLTRFRLHSANAHLQTKGVELLEEMTLILDDIKLADAALGRGFLTDLYADAFWSAVFHRYMRGKGIDFPSCMRQRDIVLGTVRGIGRLPNVLSRHFTSRRLHGSVR